MILYYSPAVGNAIISTVISVHWSTLDDSWMYRINWSTDSIEESELQPYQRGIFVSKTPWHLIYNTLTMKEAINGIVIFAVVITIEILCLWLGHMK